MFKSFLNGIGFGFGFSIAVAIIIFATSQFNSPFNKKQITSTTGENVGYEERNNWNELPLAEKIKKSTAIAIVRFRKEDDGLNAAYVEEIFKRQPNTKLGIKIGDRIEKSDFYSQGGISTDRNGVVIFYVRDPGVAVDQSYLYDDRMIAEGDIPLDLFLKKYKGVD